MSDLIRREEVKDKVDVMLALLQVPKDLREEATELFIDRIPTADNSIALLPNGELLVDTEYTDQVESVRLMNFEGFTRVFKEPKVGHWIKHIDDLFPADSTIECSVCHEEQYTTIDDNYCPNCGAKMEGE